MSLMFTVAGGIAIFFLCSFLLCFTVAVIREIGREIRDFWNNA